MAQSPWDVLKTRADSYFKIAEVVLAANNDDLIQNALENLHFALELSMKAVIAKNGGIYPDYGRRGHNLEELVLYKFADGVTCILVVAKERNAVATVGVGLSSWSMDCRYIAIESLEDMKDAINDYKELYQWIKENLLK